MVYATNVRTYCVISRIKKRSKNVRFIYVCNSVGYICENAFILKWSLGRFMYNFRFTCCLLRVFDLQ